MTNEELEKLEPPKNLVKPVSGTSGKIVEPQPLQSL